MNKSVKIGVLFVVIALLLAMSVSAAEKPKVRYMVGIEKGANAALIKNFVEQNNGVIKYDWTNGEAVNAITIIVPEQALQGIQRMPGVSWIKEDVYYPHAIDLDESVYVINSDNVWAEGITGSGIRACVVDTGVGPHSNVNVVAEYDFYNNDPDASDDHGHGTHCAGTIASTHSTWRGNAYGVGIMAAKTISSSGGGYESDTVDGIYWCAKGPDGTYGTGDEADVISISLGFSLHSGTCDSAPAASAANDAVDHGVFVAAASGNDCLTTQIGNPSCGSKVMSIGATYDANVGGISWCCDWLCISYCTDNPTYADKIVCFSNGNSQLDVVAPGSIITSTVPTGTCSLCDPSGFNDASGTSMSTPHTAALGALLLEEDPTLTPAGVRQVIRDTAVDLGQPFNRQGYGRIDAYAAWQEVSGGCNSSADCYDGNECTQDICDTQTGECSNPPEPDNATCTGGICCAGACSVVNCSGSADCNDYNQCTFDYCFFAGGCDAYCENPTKPDDTPCTGGICCGGWCSTPDCVVNADCDDSEACTTDTCYNGNTCNAYCDSVWPVCGIVDGCCGPGCTPANDPDCGGEVCGDGYCAGSSAGEDCNSCPADCISGQGGTCAACWKGRCDGSCNPKKETEACADCAPSYCCGDYVCEGSETVANCEIDCGCQDNADCNDGEPCTTDVCNAGVCENTWPFCGLSDGCCGPTCTPANDPDCYDCSTCFKGVCDGSCHPVKEDATCPDCQ